MSYLLSIVNILVVTVPTDALANGAWPSAGNVAVL